ncbi:undecaprenyl-diphosphatase [Clostridium sp. CTA-19]
MNFKLFDLVNQLAGKSKLMDNIMIIFSKYVPIIFAIVILVLYIYGFVKKDKNTRAIAINTGVFTVLNLFLSAMIGMVYYHPRPFVSHDVNLLFPHSPNASFPSDHSTFTMSIALGINKYSKVYGVILITLSCIVGVSRLYVGHHYPLDVIGAYILVFITNYLYSKFLSKKVANLYLKLEGKILK